MTTQKNSVHLLDETGLLLQLPYDLTVPFARYIIHKKINNLKRYTVGKVYRYHNLSLRIHCRHYLNTLNRSFLLECFICRKNTLGGQPREIHECDFDIVGPKHNKFVYCAEILKIVSEVFTQLVELGSFVIKVFISFGNLSLSIHSLSFIDIFGIANFNFS